MSTTVSATQLLLNILLRFCSINDPCGGNLCRRPFSFINNCPLTDNIQDFVNKMNNESISGNLDFPEGGIDALMQVVVCRDVSFGFISIAIYSNIVDTAT